MGQGPAEKLSVLMQAINLKIFHAPTTGKPSFSECIVYLNKVKPVSQRWHA
jgi:hypothetical protein